MYIPEGVEVYLDEETVDGRIKALGEEISKDYAGKEPILIGILKGSIPFMAQLAKRISLPAEFDFMAVSSYGNSRESSGKVRIIKDTDYDIKGKDVIVIEDIVDTGITMTRLFEMLKGRGACSLKLCTLLDKPSRRQVDIEPDYCGFEVPDKFMVGYGMDYAQKYRNLPYIGALL